MIRIEKLPNMLVQYCIYILNIPYNIPMLYRMGI